MYNVQCTEMHLNKYVRKHMTGNRGDLYGLEGNPNIVNEKTSHINGVLEFWWFFFKLHMLSCPFYLGSN